MASERIQEVAFIEDIDVRGANPIIEVSGHLPFMVAFGEDFTRWRGCSRRATTFDGWSRTGWASCSPTRTPISELAAHPAEWSVPNPHHTGDRLGG